MRETVTSIHNRMINAYKSALGVNQISNKSFIFILTYALAGIFYGFYFALNRAKENFFLHTTSDATTINDWGSFIGVRRGEGSITIGSVTITVTDGWTEDNIAQGTRLLDDVGNVYIVRANTTIPAYVANGNNNHVINIESDENGLDKNKVEGAEIFFETTIENIETLATVNAGGLTGGSDRETDSEYRDRLLLRLRNVNTGGNRNDYVNWAKNIGGVGKVFIIENFLFINTVGVIFLTTNRNNLIPNRSLIQEVQDEINRYRPLGALPIAAAPQDEPINISIRLSPNTAQVRQNVTDQLREMFLREAEVGGIVYLSKISEAVSLAVGEIAHEITRFDAPGSPRGDNQDTSIYQLRRLHVGTLGVISFITF